MKPRRQLEGEKFTRLTVLEFVGYRPFGGGRKAFFKVRCDCGVEKEVSGHNLAAGTTKSCGCYNRDRISTRTGAGSRPRTR